ncbi:hypothetical protein CALCODRAFT_154829 [Calocera cornea HHB12733]|uniref:Uncharacterized protein n=1 Tax=Calocera cornea HHB12733 TaxID=1353952 RepID=A0A165CLT8_9BASI|nr:hypothetical protein CALCODRAFT_154829 [Calocera cornea HHB12733]
MLSARNRPALGCLVSTYPSNNAPVPIVVHHEKPAAPGVGLYTLPVGSVRLKGVGSARVQGTPGATELRFCDTVAWGSRTGKERCASLRADQHSFTPCFSTPTSSTYPHSPQLFVPLVSTPLLPVPTLLSVSKAAVAQRDNMPDESPPPLLCYLAYPAELAIRCHVAPHPARFSVSRSIPEPAP